MPLPVPIAVFDASGIGDASTPNGSNPLSPAAVGASAVPWREADGGDEYLGVLPPVFSNVNPLIVAMGTTKAARINQSGGATVALKRRSDNSLSALTNAIIAAANDTGVTIRLMVANPDKLGTDPSYRPIFMVADDSGVGGLGIMLHNGHWALYAKHTGGNVVLSHTTGYSTTGKYIIVARFGGGVAESGHVNNVPFPISGGRTDALLAPASSPATLLCAFSNTGGSGQYMTAIADVASVEVFPGLVSDSELVASMLDMAAAGTVPLSGYAVESPVVDMANDGHTFHVGHSDGGTGPITHKLQYATGAAADAWVDVAGQATKSNPADGSSQTWDVAAFLSTLSAPTWLSVLASDGNATNDARSSRVYVGDGTSSHFNPADLSQIAGRAVPNGDVVYQGNPTAIAAAYRWPDSEVIAGQPQTTKQGTTSSLTLSTATRLSGATHPALTVIDSGTYDGVGAQNSLQIDHTGFFTRGNDDSDPIPLTIGFTVLGGTPPTDRKQALIDIVDKADQLALLLYLDNDNSIKLKLSDRAVGDGMTYTHTEPGQKAGERLDGSLTYDPTEGQWKLTIRGVEKNVLSGGDATARKYAPRHLERFFINENSVCLFGRAMASTYYQTWPNEGNDVRPFVGKAVAFWFSNATVRVGQALPAIDGPATITVNTTDTTGKIVGDGMQGTLYPLRPDADASPSGIPQVRDVSRVQRIDFFAQVNDLSTTAGARGRCNTVGWCWTNKTLINSSLGWMPSEALYHDFSRDADLLKLCQILNDDGTPRIRVALGAAYTTPYSGNPDAPAYDPDDEDFAGPNYVFTQDMRAPTDLRKWAIETTDRIAAKVDLMGIEHVESVCGWNEPMGAFFNAPDGVDVYGTDTVLTWDPAAKAAYYADMMAELIPLMNVMLQQKATLAGKPKPPFLVCEHAGSSGNANNGSQPQTRLFWDEMAAMIADTPLAMPDGVGNHRYGTAWLETDHVEQDVQYFEGLLGLPVGTLVRAYTEWGPSGTTTSGRSGAVYASAYGAAFHTVELLRMLRHGARYSIMYQLGPHTNDDVQATTDGNIVVPSLASAYAGALTPSNVRATGNAGRLFDAALTGNRLQPTDDSGAAARKLPVLVQAAKNEDTGNLHLLLVNHRFAEGEDARVAITLDGMANPSVVVARRVDRAHSSYTDMGVSPPAYLEEDAQDEMVTGVAGNVVSVSLPPASVYWLEVAPDDAGDGEADSGVPRAPAIASATLAADGRTVTVTLSAPGGGPVTPSSGTAGWIATVSGSDCRADGQRGLVSATRTGNTTYELVLAGPALDRRAGVAVGYLPPLSRTGIADKTGRRMRAQALVPATGSSQIATDRYAAFGRPEQPTAGHIYPITPSDTLQVDEVPVLINSTEDCLLKVTDLQGDESVVQVVTGDNYLPVRKVWATGSTLNATVLHGKV